MSTERALAHITEREAITRLVAVAIKFREGQGMTRNYTLTMRHLSTGEVRHESVYARSGMDALAKVCERLEDRAWCLDAIVVDDVFTSYSANIGRNTPG